MNGEASGGARSASIGFRNPGRIEAEPVLQNGGKLVELQWPCHATSWLLLDENKSMVLVASDQGPGAVGGGALIIGPRTNGDPG